MDCDCDSRVTGGCWVYTGEEGHGYPSDSSAGVELRERLA